MGDKVLNRWINFKDGVTVIPGKLLNTIFVHLVLNLDLLLVWYLTVLESDSLTLNTRLSCVYFRNDEVLYVFSLICHASKKSDDLMLAQVRVDVHEHLDFESKVNPIWLRLEGVIGLALHQLVLICRTKLQFKDVEVTRWRLVLRQLVLSFGEPLSLWWNWVGIFKLYRSLLKRLIHVLWLIWLSVIISLLLCLALPGNRLSFLNAWLSIFLELNWENAFHRFDLNQIILGLWWFLYPLCHKDLLLWAFTSTANLMVNYGSRWNLYRSHYWNGRKLSWIRQPNRSLFLKYLIKLLVLIFLLAYWFMI